MLTWSFYFLSWLEPVGHFVLPGDDELNPDRAVAGKVQDRLRNWALNVVPNHQELVQLWNVAVLVHHLNT